MIPGEQIKAARRSLGWTRTTLANAAGVPVATIRLAELPGFDHGVSQAMRSKVEATLESGGATLVRSQASVEISTPKNKPTITPEQIKAARTLLGWSTATLALKTRRTVGGVTRAESGLLNARQADASLRTLKRALEAAGVVFVVENGGQPGVRLREKS